VSGFAGIVRMEPTLETAEVDRVAIARMAEAIALRGPDAQQQFSRDGASFAFSLLSTGPAPQAAEQPVTLDGETFFLGDARIDGRNELIAKLQQHGTAIPPSTTDERLALHFVARFGIESLPELDGDFSFVLWKPREKQLTAFRDLTGARPFFYSNGNSKFCFSNTVQAVLTDSDLAAREFDIQFIGDFLLGGPHQDPERTIYRDVRRLPAGSLLEWSAAGLSIRRIANLPVEHLLVLRDEQVVEEFRRLFSEAVRDRLPGADTSIFLSGGLDSTSIAAEVVKLRGASSPNCAATLHALCVDFRPLFDDDEGRYASQFANAFGIPLQIVHSGDRLPFAEWEESFSRMPEPLMDPYGALYLSYRKQASEKARVVLSGDGGDEVLRLQAAPYLRFLARERGPWNAAAALAQWMLSNGKVPWLGFGIRSGFYRRLGHVSPELRYPPWLSGAFEREHNLRERWSEMWTPPRPLHPFNPKAYHAMNSGLFAEVQEVCDPTWTLVPLETRNPFLDRRLCRFLLRIPVVPWAMNKQLLRVAQAGVLPEEIRRRPKTPVQQDLLVLHVKAGSWQPTGAENPADLLRPLVDWRLLSKFLSKASDTFMYVHLRPIALSFWLKAVEMLPRIQ
jgi:asparagine synthase (glutamine-hydrolysing)